ncbi:MAG: T9SS type A sorting domain-containing protein [Ignavibacteriales bacterium]|nr:T9SS type A sorting domain-containing protein [Ignavibacteriales bacterium]
MNAKKLTVLIIFITTIVYAQQTENYFPHAIGNAWQYKYDNGRIFKDVIVKDSLLADSSKLLLVLNPLLNKNTNNDILWSYQVSKNQDSVIKWPNSIDILLYKFPMKPGDKWMLWDTLRQAGYMGHCWGEFTASVFGVITKGYYIDYFSKNDLQDTSTQFYTWAWREDIADGFGKIWWGNEVEYYQLMGCIINGVKYGTITDVEEKPDLLKPENFCLFQNYPNPFNPSTTIRYSISTLEKVKLLIYSLIGEELKILVDQYQNIGTYETNFNAANLPSGIYFCRLTAGKYSAYNKMILIK